MSFVVVLPFFIQSFFLHLPSDRLYLHSFPTRRSSDLLHLCSMHPKNISIKDFTYDLPNERIATYPLHPRDSSKLLVYKDRKSTRLNSSHVAISYAVFCLKKKKH